MRKGLMMSCFVAISVVIFCITYFSSKKKPTHFEVIDSFSQLQEQFDTMGPNSFVLFDVNDTLVTSSDYIARHFFPPTMFSVLAALRHLRLIYERGYAERLFSIMLQQAPRFLIEPLIVPMINRLKKQGAYVLIASNMSSGSVGLIENMSEWNADMLKNCGIVVSQHFGSATFTTLKQRKNHYPTLHKGILSCNRQPKGEVIGAFLDYFKLTPDKIVFIDDTLSNLVSVHEECVKRNIPSFCYHYKGVARLKQPTWSMRRAFVQLDYLMRYEAWISDDEADSVQQGVKSS